MGNRTVLETQNETNSQVEKVAFCPSIQSVEIYEMVVFSVGQENFEKLLAGLHSYCLLDSLILIKSEIIICCNWSHLAFACPSHFIACMT